MSEGYWLCVWLSAYLLTGFTIAYVSSAYGPKDWADVLLDTDFPLGLLVVMLWPAVGAVLATVHVCRAFQRDVMRRRKIRDAVKDPAPEANGEV